MTDVRTQVDRVVHAILRGGMAASAFFLLAGVAVALLTRQPLPLASTHLDQLGRGLRLHEPGALVTTGIGLLILTPVLRVIGSIFAFAHGRDFRFAAIGAAVLLLMLVSLLLGKG